MKDFAKGVPRWVRGVFAKKSEISDEFIVLTPAGAHTFRTVRRLPGDQRHNVECLESTAGLPWATKDAIQRRSKFWKSMPSCTSIHPPKADLTSALLIAHDTGDDQGQPTCLKPPYEWLSEYEAWLVVQDQKVQREFPNVLKQHIVRETTHLWETTRRSRVQTRVGKHFVGKIWPCEVPISAW